MAVGVAHVDAASAGIGAAVDGDRLGHRLAARPDEAREQGFDVVVTKFRGIAGPKGLPPAVVEIWEQSIQRVLALPEYQKIYKSENLVPAYRNQKESREFTADMATSLAASLRELGIVK